MHALHCHCMQITDGMFSCPHTSSHWSFCCRVSEALQRKELRQHATDAALQLAAAVFAAAATATLVPRSSKGGAGGEAGGRKHAGSRADLRLRLLPAAHVLLLWLATHPEVARCCLMGFLSDVLTSRWLSHQHRRNSSHHRVILPRFVVSVGCCFCLLTARTDTASASRPTC